MPYILPISPAVTITGTIAIVAILLYLREYFLRKKKSLYQREFSEETKQKTLQFLKAAEEAEIQTMAEGKFTSQKLESQFKAQLENLIQTASNSITNSQNELIKFMEDLKIRGEDFEEASKKTSEQRINQLFERLETRISDFLIQTEQKTTSSIELELKATRQLIDTYRTQQLKLIDENIIAMMEQTLNMVLGKKLSLKDQLDLVYEALERAKVDKFIV